MFVQLVSTISFNKIFSRIDRWGLKKDQKNVGSAWSLTGPPILKRQNNGILISGKSKPLSNVCPPLLPSERTFPK